MVNIGRGALIDQDALCDLLDEGHLSGAVLDVFTPEPIPPGHRLWSTRNLIISPHTSADDPHTYNPRSLDLFFDNLRAWRDGKAHAQPVRSGARLLRRRHSKERATTWNSACSTSFNGCRGRPRRKRSPNPSSRWMRLSAAGLDVMWLAELHTAPERSVLASPLMLATAIAARTKRMKIGTAVQVLPLCHPLQLAEEVATVDHISHGRLIFGVGRSGFPRVYQAYGVSYAESRDRFAEVLEILKRAWTQERFSFDGKYLSLRRRLSGAEAVPEAVSGDPRRGDQPRHLSRRTARMGNPIFCATRLGDLSELVRT